MATEAEPGVVRLQAEEQRGLLGAPESRREAFSTFLRVFGHLDIRLLASRTVRKKCDCLKPPCFGHLRWQL